MLKVINHTGTTSGTQCLKFPIDVDPRGPYKHHIEVSIDTGADVNCMNEKTFRRLFPKVELSVCPHNIQNFANSTADIYILGQFRTYLQFRGKKYLNTFIVTNANDCPQHIQPWYKTYGSKSTKENLSPKRTDPVQLLQPVQQSSQKFQKHMKQPVRKQVWLYTLLICLRLRLLAGPCHLPKPKPKPIPHTVLDDQPLKHINFPHIYLTCMYTNNRARLARRENRQP